MLKFGNEWTSREKLEEWLSQAMIPGTALPFSFVYGGVSSRTLLNDCEVSRGEDKLTFMTKDALKIEYVMHVYDDFPAAEWVLYFENTGDSDSAFLEDVNAIDLYTETSPFRTAGTKQYGAHDNILHYSGGSDCKIDDFIPLQEVIHHISNTRHWHFGSVGGRPTSGSHGALPYFDLETQQNGVIVAIGWSGQWQLDFESRTQEYEGGPECFHWVGGMPGVHTILHTGERIRTPRILIMPYVGDRVDAHNVFRRFMVKYHTPHIDGKHVRLPFSALSWGLDEKRNLAEIEAIKKTGLPFDTYWIDAGWYGPAGTHCDDAFCQDWSDYVGYWDHDPVRFPNGLKPISDSAHAAGMNFLLWMEPDRASLAAMDAIEHPEYYLKGAEPGWLFNLGDPEAWQWMLEKLSGKIREYGMDVLRVDYNSEFPLRYWDANDAPNRRGMTQIRAVEGFYALWDELLRRFPKLRIDNCASGGRRLDFEALTRSIALFRSDYLCYADNDPIGVQIQNGGLAQYIPVSSTTMPVDFDDYRLRSTLSQGFGVSIGAIAKAAANETTRKRIEKALKELIRTRDLFYGDYYPLTGVSMCKSDWFAYEVHEPTLGRAAVVSIRRDECPMTEACYLLRGLEADAKYAVTDADSGETTVVTGDSLMKDGLTIRIPQRRSSRLTYIDKI